jgi:site-specific recombinase XerD
VHRFTFPPGTAVDAVRRFARDKALELRGQEAQRGAGKRRRGTPGVAPRRVSDLCDAYEHDPAAWRDLGARTRVTYRASLAVVRRFFVAQGSDPRVDEVRAKDVRAFVEWRHTAPTRPTKTRTAVSPRTVAKDRAFLHLLFDYAERQEWRQGNPVALTDAPKSDPHEPVILTDAELARLLDRAAARPMLHFYLVLLAEAGLRAKTEALWLRWADVDLEAGFLRIKSGKRHRGEHQTKTRRARSVPMTAALVRAYRAHAAAYRLSAPGTAGGSEWLFHYDRARRGHAAGERVASLDGGARRVIRDAKLPAGFRLHDLRHRRVTTWLAEGKSPVHVREAVGHASLATTMRYTHLLPEHLRALVDDPSAAATPEGPTGRGAADRAKSAQSLAQTRAPRAG